MSKRVKWSLTKLVGPYADAMVALVPRLTSDMIAGTSGELYVMRLNMAWFVPSAIVSNETSSSIVRSAGSSAMTSVGTSARSSTSWYASTVPRSVSGAEEE